MTIFVKARGRLWELYYGVSVCVSVCVWSEEHPLAQKSAAKRKAESQPRAFQSKGNEGGPERQPGTGREHFCTLPSRCQYSYSSTEESHNEHSIVLPTTGPEVRSRDKKARGAQQVLEDVRFELTKQSKRDLRKILDTPPAERRRTESLSLSRSPLTRLG